MNLGLSDLLLLKKYEFNNFSPVDRPIIILKTDLYWISGFVTGQGNFDVKISEQSTNKIGFRVQLRFRISQHPRGRRARRSREREIKNY